MVLGRKLLFIREKPRYCVGQSLRESLTTKNQCRFKARLLSRRFFQKRGIHYSETFALAVPFEVLLLLVGKFVSEGWHVHQAGISTTFLYGGVDGELYMSWENVVYRLKKRLYGLKQSPRL